MILCKILCKILARHDPTRFHLMYLGNLTRSYLPYKILRKMVRSCQDFFAGFEEHCGNQKFMFGIVVVFVCFCNEYWSFSEV
jgi:hypothetical protein